MHSTRSFPWADRFQLIFPASIYPSMARPSFLHHSKDSWMADKVKQHVGKGGKFRNELHLCWHWFASSMDPGSRLSCMSWNWDVFCLPSILPSIHPSFPPHELSQEKFWPISTLELYVCRGRGSSRIIIIMTNALQSGQRFFQTLGQKLG